MQIKADELSRDDLIILALQTAAEHCEWRSTAKVYGDTPESRAFHAACAVRMRDEMCAMYAFQQMG